MDEHLWAIYAGDKARGAELAGSDGGAGAKLSKVIEGQGLKKFLYVYDFGDNWQVSVAVKKVVDLAEAMHRKLIGGALAFPPEDCGGIWGYEHHAELARRDPATDQGDDAEEREWFGDWHPDAFELAAEQQAFDQQKKARKR